MAPNDYFSEADPALNSSTPQNYRTQPSETSVATLLRVAVAHAGRKLSLPLILCCIASANPAFAQTPTTAPSSRVVEQHNGASSIEGLPIIRVEVAGNTRTDSHLILDQVRAQNGQRYSRALTDVDVRSIASLDRFVTVRAEVVVEEDPQTHILRGVVIRFIVEERPIAIAVELRGNRLFNDGVIRDGLIMHAGSSIDPFSIQTDTKTILDMYRKKGYAQASVDVDQDAMKQGVVRYNITEGSRAYIRSVRFDGNNNVNSDFLKFKIQTRSHFWILRKGILDEEKVQQDLITIRDAYLKRGYLDARVSYSLEYLPDKSGLAVRFAVLEGPRYKIGQVHITGNKVFSREELLGDLKKFGPGSYAERDKIQALQKRVEDTYGGQGYIYRNVEVNTPYTDTPGVVNLDFNVDEGKPYIVGRIIVRGNAGVQDRVIRRQVRIYPDQTYDAVLVRKSVERLKAARIFSDVKITPIVPPGNPEGVRDALVEVGEGQTGRFLIGAGVSTNSGLVGQISLEQQNFDISNPPHSMGEFLRGQSFKGAGQYFRILLEPGTEFQRYRITFEEPYLFDSPYSLSNDIYYFTRGRESWDERRVGDTVTFGRRFGDVWSASLALRAEQVMISNVNDANHNDVTDFNYFLTNPATGISRGPFSDTAQEILDNQGSKFLTSIKPSIVRDTTDSRIFPTEGTRTVLSWEQYGAIGGSFTFSKVVGRFDWYIPLFEDIFERKTVFSLRNQVGVIAFGNAPFYERFYGGGIGDLRGFKFRGVGPIAGPLKDPIGGDISWVSTAEVNFPIYEKMLRGVVFVDVGTVERNVELDTIRADIGAGVRVTIPFFGQLPLALDFAVPIAKADGDRTQVVSFSLGIPF